MLKVKWETLHVSSREQILSDACINTKFAHYEWEELEPWLQGLIRDSLLKRSKEYLVIEEG